MGTVGSVYWYLEQISTVSVTFVHATFVSATFAQIRNISATQFWPNFKGRILGPCLKDADCYGDICQGNICPGDICSYMQYLSFYWSNFDQFFLDHDFCGPKYSWTKLLWTHIFLMQIFFPDPKERCNAKFLEGHNLWTRPLIGPISQTKFQS